MRREPRVTDEMSVTDLSKDASLDTETQQRLALITSRFPDRFDDALLAQIRSRTERSIKLGQSLRATTLANGVGPDLVVTAPPPRSEAE